MRLLMTGATGFLGKHVAAALSQDHSFELTLVPWERKVMGDLRCRERRIAVLEEHRPDAVLHLAWTATTHSQYQDDPSNSSWGDVGVAMLHECLERGIWHLGVGSAADESGDPRFSSPYSDAKRYLKSVVEPYAISGQATWLRPQYVVSLADKRPRVIREYFQWRADTEFEVNSPSAQFDFVEVRDVAHGVVTTLRNGLKGVVDLGSGYLHSVAQLLAAAERSVGAARLGSMGAAVGSRRSECAMQTLICAGWEPVYTRNLFDESMP